MPTRKISMPVNTGRKAAYFARNHEALLKSAQGILAEVGPQATIDEVADYAEVSVSTIYKHFETKEDLFAAAIISAMREWEIWADEILGELEEPLKELVYPMRLLLRIKQTHPTYARMIGNNIADMPNYVPGISSGLALHVKELVKAKILGIDNVEIRIQSVSACLLAAMSNQLLHPRAKESDGDAAIEIALGILGISPAKAKKLAHDKMPIIRKA